MAEITRHETITEKTNTIGPRRTPQRERQTHVRVSSFPGRTAEMVRDFVAALDAAGAPHSAQVTAHRDYETSGLSGLSAEWTFRPEDEPEAADADAS